MKTKWMKDFDPSFTPYIEISLKWITVSHVNNKIIEFLGENIDENLCNTRTRQRFYIGYERVTFQMKKVIK